MRQTAVAAVTMIVSAGLLGIARARLPRPIRDYRDRVRIEMSAIAPIEAFVDWLEASYGGPIGRDESR
jgi:hypothetical protein